MLKILKNIERFSKEIYLNSFILKNHQFDFITEIAIKVHVPEERIIDIARFLSDFGFAHLDSDEEKVRLDSDFLKLPV